MYAYKQEYQHHPAYKRLVTEPLMEILFDQLYIAARIYNDRKANINISLVPYLMNYLNHFLSIQRFLINTIDSKQLINDWHVFTAETNHRDYQEVKSHWCVRGLILTSLYKYSNMLQVDESFNEQEYERFLDELHTYFINDRIVGDTITLISIMVVFIYEFSKAVFLVPTHIRLEKSIRWCLENESIDNDDRIAFAMLRNGMHKHTIQIITETLSECFTEHTNMILIYNRPPILSFDYDIGDVEETVSTDAPQMNIYTGRKFINVKDIVNRNKCVKELSTKLNATFGKPIPPTERANKAWLENHTNDMLFILETVTTKR